MKKRSSFVMKLMLSYVLILIVPCLAFSLFYKSRVEQDFMKQYSAIISDSMNTLDNALGARIERLRLNAESIEAECALTSFLHYNVETRDYLIIDHLLSKLLPALKRYIALNPDTAQAVLIHKNQILPDVFYRIYRAPERVAQVGQKIESGECVAHGKKLYQSGLHDMDVFHEVSPAYQSEALPVLSFYYCVDSLFRTETLGYLEFDIAPEQLFSGAIPLLTIEDGFVSIRQRDGEMIYTSDAERASQLTPGRDPGEVWIGADRYFRFEYELSNVPFDCVSYLPAAAVTAAQNRAYNAYVLVLCAALVVAFAALMGIAYMLSRNMRWLARRVNEIAAGDLNVDTHVPGNDEVSDLGRMLFAMQARIRELIEKTVLLGESERAAVYAGLVNQLKPHFMCNALNTLRIRAGKQGAHQIARSIGLVSNYFRYNMSDSGQFVTLRKELENAVDYISIYNMMADDAQGEILLNVLYNGMDSQALERHRVLKYVLQPTLENAAKHGFQNGAEHPEIVITLKREKDKLRLTVEDNGCGIPSEQLDALNRRIHSAPAQLDVGRTTSIGLENLYSRLSIHFGDRADLSLDSYLGIGTKVNIEMPLLDENGKEAADFGLFDR